ncbi:MAG: elongation factor P [Patescibacteria group bacterium]|jgi:elongation factor P|nr:elongation factor P [bacterium]HQC50045.1 elongation factor P [bacterium]
MLNFNEIKTGRVIKVNGEPYIIIKTDHHKMGRGGAVLKTKCRNLINGSILEKTFQGVEKAEEAETQTKKANFLYKDKDEAFFMDNESYEQFSLQVEEIGDSARFLKDGTDVDVLYFEGRPVSISLPIKMEFKVVSAPPGVKGNSAGNVNKVVEIETGAKINAPMFINEGDLIRVNTDTGEYVERVN